MAILEELEGVPEVKEESEEKELKEVEPSPEGETAAEEIKNEPEEGEPAKELAKSSSWTCFLCEIQWLCTWICWNIFEFFSKQCINWILRM